MVARRRSAWLLTLGLGSATLPGLTACSSDDSDERGNGSLTIGVQEAAAGAAGDADGFSPDNAASLAAFSDTLWPLLKEHCSGCHGGSTSPFFAVDEAYEAHKTVISSHLVAPAAVPSSRFVTRLALNNHNCWSECPKDADTMLAAIKAWLDHAGIKGGGDNLLRVGPVDIADAEETWLAGGGGNWVREAENFESLSAAAFEIAEEGTASLKKALRRVTVPMGQTAPQGEASYSFPIPKGTASLWFKLRAYNNGRSITYRVNGGNVRTVNIPNGDNGAWVWVRAFADEAVEPLLGANVVTLAISSAAAMVDMIAFTKNATFDRSLIENTGKRQVLKFDLESVLGKKATLTLHLAPGPDGASYILSHPTIQLREAAKIRVEKIYILANGEYNPQYSTFASIATTVAATTELSPRGLVVTKRDADDAMTLGFGTLQLEP